MKLTLGQAINIRDDYKYLEGEVLSKNDLNVEINNILVVPYDGKLFSKFQKKFYDEYFEEVDDVWLAQAVGAKSFNVAAFLEDDTYGQHFFSQIWDILNDLGKQFDKDKYGFQ